MWLFSSHLLIRSQWDWLNFLVRVVFPSALYYISFALFPITVSGKCLAVFSTRIKWCWCFWTESFVWLIQGNLNIFLREVLLQATLVHFIWPALLNLLFCLITVLETLWLKAHLHQNKFPRGLLLWWNGIN